MPKQNKEAEKGDYLRVQKLVNHLLYTYKFLLPQQPKVGLCAGKVFMIFNFSCKKCKNICEATSSTKITESYLLQSPMLCKGPVGHDGSSDHKKNVACDSLCCNVET